MVEVGWAEGTCPECGRVWRRKRPADLAICDCYIYCPICDRRFEDYTPNMDPKIYRSEDVDDPTGAADKQEATIRTRFHCSYCDYYSDGVPEEVELR